MADNRYIVTHSNYTIKKKHKSLSGDTIYERDYMTTSNLGGWDSGAIPYGEGNFKVIYNNDKNLKRKHKYGNWLKNENCTDTDSDNCNYFTSGTMVNGDSETVTRESRIEIKPNKNSLLDFVYFGNCTEMIKSTIDDIIIKFPAELYVSDQNYKYYNAANELVILGNEDMVVVDNPFGIDIKTQSLTQKEKNDISYNPMRYFSESLTKYRIIDNKDESHCINSWKVDIRDKRCYKNGNISATILLNEGESTEILIKEYYADGEFILLTDKQYSGYHIRPTEGAILNFFNDIDDFERVLLNKETNPTYTIDIDVPKDTERGVVTTRQRFTWPISNGWNLDFQSNLFTRYYDALLNVAEWYDENRTDNLWRNMTHDSIKNMDRTHTDPSKDEDNTDYKIGTSRVHGLFYAIGREFDDIKRNIDNIKSVNKMTYDENNNTPDYFLTDQLELSGWEVKNAVETINAETKTGILYSGSNKKYDATDANIQFIRNLKMNSRAIFAKKGTKDGIESLLSLFGLCSYDWAKKRYTVLPDSLKIKSNNKILEWNNLSAKEKDKLYDYELKEYVAVVNNSSSDIVYADEQLPVEKYNEYKLNYNSEANSRDLYGLPVRLVTIIQQESGVEVTKKYLIPWFDKEETLDGNPYFQMFGGWGKALKKDIVPNKELYPNVNEIITTTGFTIYDETKKYLKIVDTIDNLAKLEYDDVNNGDIFYVNDIQDIATYYPYIDISGVTNYFTIEDKDNMSIYGETSGGTGWENISKDVLSCDPTANDLAYKVIYLESIIEDNSGNNPHVGYGKYDDGESFLDYFRQLFKGAIETSGFTDDAYDCETGEILDEIKNCGFSVKNNVIDNMKVWFFTDNTKENVYRLKEVEAVGYDSDVEEFKVKVGYELSSTTPKVKVGKSAYNSGEAGFRSDLSAFNLETQMDNDNDEASANSIINTKKLTIKFNDKYTLQSGFKNYLYTVILPYLKQVIPSTTILEVLIDNSEVDFTCFNIAEITGMSK